MDVKRRKGTRYMPNRVERAIRSATEIEFYAELKAVVVPAPCGFGPALAIEILKSHIHRSPGTPDDIRGDVSGVPVDICSLTVGIPETDVTKGGGGTEGFSPPMLVTNPSPKAGIASS